MPYLVYTVLYRRMQSYILATKQAKKYVPTVYKQGAEDERTK
jgi:hypothetical protein